MFVSAESASLFTVAFGAPTAPPILGIGGWIGSWELWTLPFARLSARWYTLAYDHRGSGATVAPVTSIVFDTLVEDVFAVLDAYGVASAVLAAESAGAAVAVAAALRRPDRVRGLVLVDALVHQAAPQADDAFLHGLLTAYPQTLDWFVDACVPETGLDHIKRWGRQIIDRAEPAAAVALYRAVGTVDLRPQLPSLTQPTLIIHGAADRLVPPADAHRLAATLPDSRLVMLPGAGHVPTLTRPAAVAEAIDAFFAP